MILLKYAYLIVLTAVVVLAMAALFLNLKMSQRSFFDRVMASFLTFLVIHSVYICFARYVYAENVFVDIGAPFSLFYAPFFYTLLISLKEISHWAFRRIFVHFLPAFVFVVLYVIILTDLNLYQSYIPNFLAALYLGAGIQFIGYAVFGFVKYNNALDAGELKLMTNYAIKVMVLVALIFLSVVFDDGFTADKTAVNGLVIYLFMFFLAVLLFKYHVSTIFRTTAVANSLFSESEGKANLEGKALGAKYEKSRISDAEGALYLERLNDAMERDHVYLDSELTIDRLAKKLKITKHHLTQVFTIVLDTNFNKHINTYRVKHASELLKNNKNKMSIGDIGTECGFNSRTSFYRVFKIHFGVSPADYRKMHQIPNFKDL